MPGRGLEPAESEVHHKGHRKENDPQRHPEGELAFGCFKGNGGRVAAVFPIVLIALLLERLLKSW